MYGTAEALVIPVPEVQDIGDEKYNKSYKSKDDFKPPKQYVHVQGMFFGLYVIGSIKAVTQGAQNSPVMPDNSSEFEKCQAKFEKAVVIIKQNVQCIAGKGAIMSGEA